MRPLEAPWPGCRVVPSPPLRNHVTEPIGGACGWRASSSGRNSRPAGRGRSSQPPMSSPYQRKAPWDRSNKYWCKYCSIFVFDNRS
ncbi:hypothetical protein H4R21_005645, partial [Coemansia helicoidea]